MSRPEHLVPPEIYYGADQAKRYARSSRMHSIQKQLAERALELLLLPTKGVVAENRETSGTVRNNDSDEMDGEYSQKQQLQQSCLLLDLGFGSGISAACLTSKGHFVVGVDISRFMLDEALKDGVSEISADALLGDLGQQLKFRPGVFDGAISISAVQWLCSDVHSTLLSSPPSFAAESEADAPAAPDSSAISAASTAQLKKSAATESTFPATDRELYGAEDVEMDCGTLGNTVCEKKNKGEEACISIQERERDNRPQSSTASWKQNTPYKRLRRFFGWLFSSLRAGGRAALQFYPDSSQQLEMITAAALHAGFGGGLVVDYPNSTKAKKYFLVLWVGGGRVSSAEQRMHLKSAALDSVSRSQIDILRRESSKSSKKRGGKGLRLTRKEWIAKKKEKQRQQGKEVRHDSKYTGRRRRDKF